MTVLDAQTVTQLQTVLTAYLSQYGGGETIADRRAITGAILSVQAKAGTLILPGLVIEAWVDAVVTAFDASQNAELAQEVAVVAIAAQAKTWRETLEIKTQATLDAYIQTYAPALSTEKIQQLIATILPIVEDAHIASDEAKRLIQVISHQFDWQAATSRVIDSKWVTFATKVHQSLQHQDVETAVQDIVQAYIHKFEPSLVEISEILAEEALSALSNSKGLLDVELELDPETRRLVVQQVAFKICLLEAAPPPSKRAVEIAQQVQREIVRYRDQQRIGRVDYIAPVTRTNEDRSLSSLGGEMSIGIALQPQYNRAAAAAPTEENCEN